jgi:SAM-dependent methyltransferase
MHSLHYAVSYRASFKPELPDYCIRHYSYQGDIVADPFCGRGTTALQANLLGRQAWSNDINPLAITITSAKTKPVPISAVEKFLSEIDWQGDLPEEVNPELLAFYHPNTLREIYLLREKLNTTDSETSGFIKLLALSRLHGHSNGFFSAYSMPQLSVSPRAQQRINKSRGIERDYRNVPERIIKKGKKALKDNQLDEIRRAGHSNRYLTSDARSLNVWPSGAVNLIVTSPPFLNTVDYLADNWLEHWFLKIDQFIVGSSLMQQASLQAWSDFMRDAMREMARVLRKGGICIIEVGEVTTRKEIIFLDDILLHILSNHPEINLHPIKVLVHTQQFTKLAHCFSVTNNKLGTNTQRLLVLEKR